MIVANWPSTLPQSLLIDGVDVKPLEQLLRSSAGYGPENVRRRTSLRRMPVIGNILVTASQVIDLDYFYTQTVRRVLPFNWTDELTGDAVECVFDGAPAKTVLKDGSIQVQLALKMRRSA